MFFPVSCCHRTLKKRHLPTSNPSTLGAPREISPETRPPPTKKFRSKIKRIRAPPITYHNFTVKNCLSDYCRTSDFHLGACNRQNAKGWEGKQAPIIARGQAGTSRKPHQAGNHNDKKKIKDK
ncbi:hypothetical protein J6590_070587 [Homalodisca vitripennis]|nr:hypothetical protein J6590_070587 [Homalodisca vitripennis]